MKVYQIPKDVLDSEYHGCGRGWASIKHGAVVAIRYDEWALSEDSTDDEIADAERYGPESRHKIMHELGRQGDVKSGMISSCEFCADE